MNRSGLVHFGPTPTLPKPALVWINMRRPNHSLCLGERLPCKVFKQEPPGLQASLSETWKCGDNKACWGCFDINIKVVEQEKHEFISSCHSGWVHKCWQDLVMLEEVLSRITDTSLTTWVSVSYTVGQKNKSSGQLIWPKGLDYFNEAVLQSKKQFTPFRSPCSERFLIPWSNSLCSEK